MHFNCLEKRQASVAAAKLAEDKKGRQPEEKKKKSGFRVHFSFATRT